MKRKSLRESEEGDKYQRKMQVSEKVLSEQQIQLTKNSFKTQHKWG